MEESTLLLSVFGQLTANFHSRWIDALNWKDTPSSKVSMNTGLAMIRETQSLIFVNFAKFALSGKHFIESYKTINSIKDWCYEDVVIDAKSKYKTALQTEYRDFIVDILDSINLLHYHIETTKEIFSAQHQNNYFNAIKRKRPIDLQGRNVKLLETVIDVCWAEYRFSFSDSFIQSILHSKEELKDALIGSSSEEKNVIEASIKKVDLMLCKLAEFSKDKQISYNYNFQQSTISLESVIKDAMDKFHTPFLQFIKPENLSNKDIEDWQKDSWGKDISMWKLVLLMRYYSKTTKNIIQINKVIEIYNKHYEESIRESSNLINDYAGRSVKNYMYNCRFSFLCQHNDNYTVNKLIEDLEQIEAIQNETFIKNYHPFQKAYLFLKNAIENELNGTQNQETLEYYLHLLKHCFEKFKASISWCQANQPYIYQLRFNYCTDNWNGIEVFCPSSYCRPLRFKELYELIKDYSNEIWSLDQRIKNNPDRIRILSAQKEIENISKRNYELLSFFSTVVIFLVGLISIFIGNTASMQDKMEYVIVLGSILLLFVCLGYFIAGQRFDKHKPKIFGGLGVLLIIMLGYYYFMWLPKQYARNSKEENKGIVIDQPHHELSQKDNIKPSK